MRWYNQNLKELTTAGKWKGTWSSKQVVLISTIKENRLSNRPHSYAKEATLEAAPKAERTEARLLSAPSQPLHLPPTYFSRLIYSHAPGIPAPGLLAVCLCPISSARKLSSNHHVCLSGMWLNSTTFQKSSWVLSEPDDSTPHLHPHLHPCILEAAGLWTKVNPNFQA